MSDPSYNYDDLAYNLYAEHDDLIEKLVYIREQHNISINELAEQMNVDVDTIRAFENNVEEQTLAFVMDYALEVGANMSIEVNDVNKRNRG